MWTAHPSLLVWLCARQDLKSLYVSAHLSASMFGRNSGNVFITAAAPDNNDRYNNSSNRQNYDGSLVQCTLRCSGAVTSMSALSWHAVHGCSFFFSSCTPLSAPCTPLPPPLRPTLLLLIQAFDASTKILPFLAGSLSSSLQFFLFCLLLQAFDPISTLLLLDTSSACYCRPLMHPAWGTASAQLQHQQQVWLLLVKSHFGFVLPAPLCWACYFPLPLILALEPLLMSCAPTTTCQLTSALNCGESSCPF